MPVSSLAPDDFAWLPATEQLAALDAKEVSSAELVELYLSRISTHNPSLNAIVTVDPDAARRAATEADAARSRGDDLGPLHGLPITVKDSYETAGMRTVCGPAAERGGWRQWPRRTRRWTKTAPSSAHADQPHRNLTPGQLEVKQCGDEDDDHSDIVMPTPRRQSPRPTTPFTDGRHHAEVGIIVYAKTCCGW